MTLKGHRVHSSPTAAVRLRRGRLRKSEQSQPTADSCPGSLDGWELMASEGGHQVYKKPYLDAGLFQYKGIVQKNVHVHIHVQCAYTYMYAYVHVHVHLYCIVVWACICTCTCIHNYTCTVEYRQSAPPIFTLGWQERGGGRINGSDRFCTRGAPPILISAPHP